MGDMTDLCLQQMERGQSIILDHKTNKKIIIDNIYLLYLDIYDISRYEVLGDYTEENYKNNEKTN